MFALVISLLIFQVSSFISKPPDLLKHYYAQKVVHIYTFKAVAVARESPVSCSKLSAQTELDLDERFSEELGDNPRSITGVREVGPDMEFCLPSIDWNAMT